MIETHRDGFPRFSALSVRRGDAGHRKACATTSESLAKPPFRWTRLSCRKLRDNEVRLQLHVLAYNLANFMRTLALPREVEYWSLTTPRA